MIPTDLPDPLAPRSRTWLDTTAYNMHISVVFGGGRAYYHPGRRLSVLSTVGEDEGRLVYVVSVSKSRGRPSDSELDFVRLAFGLTDEPEHIPDHPHQARYLMPLVAEVTP